MLNISMYITIKSLWELGNNKTQIAKITGHDWKTINKVIKRISEGKVYPEKQTRYKVLDDYQTEIVNWLENNISGVRIFEKLRSLGVKASYSTVRNYIAQFKVNNNICVRFHTEPGEEAQVDFGYVGLLPDASNKLRKAWVFNMRLSYSRVDYYEVTFDQKVETFIECHKNAFKYFNGAPKHIKIDNLKAAILEANFYEPVYQKLYQQFADYYKVKITPCRVRKPQEKGKVEAGIKYFKNNFIAGRVFNDWMDLNYQLKKWMDNYCNVRVHGTHKKRPMDLLKEEVKDLIALPSSDFYTGYASIRKVYTDCHVYINNNYYSVPYEYVGKDVEIFIQNSLIKIFYNYQQIALHTEIKDKGKFSTIDAHYPKYKNITSNEYKESYANKMQDLGAEALKFYYLVVDKYPHSWIRIISGIISLNKHYPKNVVNAACLRAIAYGALSYSKVKNICYQGSFNLPINNYEEL